MFKGTLYDEKKSSTDNLKELFNGVNGITEELNRERSTSERNMIFGSGAASGTATVPLDTARHILLLAVIGGEGVLCVLYKGSLCGRGVNHTITGTLSKTSLVYSASGTLDALIVIM